MRPALVMVYKLGLQAQQAALLASCHKVIGKCWSVDPVCRSISGTECAAYETKPYHAPHMGVNGNSFREAYPIKFSMISAAASEGRASPLPCCSFCFTMAKCSIMR